MATFTIERAQCLADAEYAFELAAKANWSPAEGEANFFYSSHPDSIFIAKLPATCCAVTTPTLELEAAACKDHDIRKAINVGCLVLMRYTPRRAHVRLLFVEESHRGRGCGKQLIRAALSSPGCDNVSVKALETSASFYQRMGFNPANWNCPQGARYRYQANELACRMSTVMIPSDNISVVVFKKDIFQSLATFDAAVFGEPRLECLENWLTLSSMFCWVALNDLREVVGYIASQKPQPDPQRKPSYKVRPLFANDVNIARLLLKALVDGLCVSVGNSADVSLIIDVQIDPEAVPEAVKFFGDELNGEIVHRFVRMYTDKRNQDFWRTFSDFP